MGSSEALLSCCTNDGLWKATQAGNVLETTRSHSAMSSGVSLRQRGTRKSVGVSARVRRSRDAEQGCGVRAKTEGEKEGTRPKRMRRAASCSSLRRQDTVVMAARAGNGGGKLRRSKGKKNRRYGWDACCGAMEKGNDEEGGRQEAEEAEEAAEKDSSDADKSRKNTSKRGQRDRNSLLSGGLHVPAGCARARDDGLSGLWGAGAGGWEALARRTVRIWVARWALAVMMGHALGGQIALVHALGAVLARRPAVLVHALGLALAAANASAAGPQGGGPDDGRRRRHDGSVVIVVAAAATLMEVVATVWRRRQMPDTGQQEGEEREETGQAHKKRHTRARPSHSLLCRRGVPPSRGRRCC